MFMLADLTEKSHANCWGYFSGLKPKEMYDRINIGACLQAYSSGGGGHAADNAKAGQQASMPNKVHPSVLDSAVGLSIDCAMAKEPEMNVRNHGITHSAVTHCVHATKLSYYSMPTALVLADIPSFYACIAPRCLLGYSDIFKCARPQLASVEFLLGTEELHAEFLYLLGR